MSYYEFDNYPTPEDFGWIHEDNLPNLDLCKKTLNSAIEAVYFSGNIDQLENCLDELCAQFDLMLPARESALVRDPKKFSEKLFDFGVALSRAQAEQIAIR